MNKKTPKATGKTVKDTAKGASGDFMGIRIVDPAVKPRGTTVKRIREAVANARKRA